ncbi:UDP-glycosyltransferase UGT5-like isoform X2 [Cylas formicarius]|uniref:UDP-glycosyltransferase UGT5-like isoform X2 n=1 Tax=Cylas formicarius TaxID=197179 RepID=UPI0029587DCE|nr:UDP-glycosyltransferase UGT5-like isoform X2 [Cylas formicarius]
MNNGLIIIFVLFFVACGYGANVLIIYPMPGKSHYILGNSLAKGLANHGFNVTLVSPFEEKQSPENFGQIVLDGILEKWEGKRIERNFSLFEFGDTPPILQSLFLNSMCQEITEEFFAHHKVQNLLKSQERFDAVVVEQFVNDALKIFAYHFKAPLIIASSLGPNFWINGLVGNPEPPAYVPNLFLNFDNEMSFTERLYNFLFGIFSQLNTHLLVYPSQNNILKKYYPDGPDLNDVIYNVSLIFLNSHESINGPVPIVPNMVPIGGYHVTPSKKLPKDLQLFLDNSKDGAIYFSLGSNVIPSQMPNITRDTILKVLGSRKENILWKWDQDSLPNKPPNFKLSKWFPQQDVLAHPNIKLFITHCGLLSTTETVYHGVPILGFPIFGDQQLNAARATTLGVGKFIDFSKINENNLEQAIDEILDNPKYLQNAKYRSQLMHDRPVKPMNLAAYWVDYVIRHKGAPHLQVAGVKLPLYKYLMLDVLAAIFATLFALFYSVYRIVKYCRAPKLKEKQN